MKINQDAVIVSVEASTSDNPHDILQSNSGFVVALLAEDVLMEDITACALRSHFVEMYRQAVKSQGFAQFVRTIKWDDETVTLIREGLATMGAMQNLNQFNQAAAILDEMPAPQLQKFLTETTASTDTACSNAYDRLNRLNPQLCETFESENLVRLNSTWLRNHPDLVTLTRDQTTAEIARRAAM